MRALAVVLIVACHASPAPEPLPEAPPPVVTSPHEAPSSEAPTAPSPGDVGTYAGLFAQGFETESFRPCDGKASWWVAGGRELRERYEQVGVRPYEPVYAVVRGSVGPEGHYGHLGGYSRQIAVTEVVELRRPTPGECGFEAPPSSPPP